VPPFGRFEMLIGRKVLLKVSDEGMRHPHVTYCFAPNFTVSVIDTATNTVARIIMVGNDSLGVAII
jgi:YVTN family beta-propeller protein